MEPTKVPSLAKGISAGLWVDLEASWATASGRVPEITCKRTWTLEIGEIFKLDVLCVLLRFGLVVFCLSVGYKPHLAVRFLFAAEKWTAKVTQPVRFTPL